MMLTMTAFPCSNVYPPASAHESPASGCSNHRQLSIFTKFVTGGKTEGVSRLPVLTRTWCVAFKADARN